MAVNKNLAAEVVNMMAEQIIKRDEGLRIICEDNVELARSMIQELGEAYIDTDYKFRHHFARFIGYGYDFTKQDESGISSKEMYDVAVENIRKVGIVSGEELVYDEIKGPHGLYLTKI